MPRPIRAGAPLPKKRSRNGCWPCKARKVKCDEIHPSCLNCKRVAEECDYSIRLNWEGRGKKRTGDYQTVSLSGISNPSLRDFGAEGIPSESNILNETEDIVHNLPRLQSRNQKLDSTDSPVHPGYNSVYPSQQFSEFAEDHPQASSDALTIDTAFIGCPGSLVSDYGPFPYNGILTQRDQLSTKNYEKYNSTESNISQALYRPKLAKICGILAHEGDLAPANSNRTRLSLQIEEGNRYGDDFDRPSKRSRCHHASQTIGGAPFLDLSPPLSNYPYVFDANTTVNVSGFPRDTSLTPVSSLTDNEDGYKSYPLKLSHMTHEAPDSRRLSVGFLLSGPPGIPCQQSPAYGSGLPAETQPHISVSPGGDIAEETTTWGVDKGFPDLDIGKNDDANALSGGSSNVRRNNPSPEPEANDQNDHTRVEFGFGVQAKSTEFQKGNYYARPVSIKIPRFLEPLPASLLRNPMNLLYFHHFISHTARILVPHHCSANPFQNILPKMALRDPNLMNLLLAYSASHRARLLHQPEPATRIALWVKDIFPNLRRALDYPIQVVSNSNLATAIMLTSLEIISPKVFGVDVPWQKHLDTARQILLWRGKCMKRDGSPVSNFLLRWFTYIDILGSLIGGRAQLCGSTKEPLLPNNYTKDGRCIGDFEFREDSDYKIDCVLGFTSRCVSILAEIAKLATICDRERIGANRYIRPEWAPSEDVRIEAEKLRLDLEAARTTNQVRPCPHLHSAGEAAYQWDTREMAATNEAYHWAGLIHLDRRILGKASTHHDVQNAVREISGILDKVRKGSTAEVCLLFPMFTAGCDAQDERQKSLIMDRLKGIEELGMSHVHIARTLMQRVWDTGRPWETLVSGEFVG